MGELTLEEKLAAAREAKERRAAALAEERAARELEELELEERFEKKTGGRRGEKFEILDFDADGGFVVVERGPAVLYKRLLESKVEHGDVSTFVLPQVAHPEKDEFKAKAGEFFGIWNACCDAIVKLHKFRANDLAGKAKSSR